MEYKVNCGIWGSMFGVPDVVADNFLKLATGQQIKVLLYLLRSSGRACSDEEIAMNTGVTAQEAADAVIFWQQANVLSSQSVQSISAVNNIMAVPQNTPVQHIENAPVQTAVPAAEVPKAVPVQQSKPVKTVMRPKQLSPSEIAEKIKSNPEIADLFTMAESILGIINNTYQSFFIWMYEYLGMKIEVIITLLGYCKSIEKDDPRYMEKIALDWNDNEINDLDSAQTEVERLTNSRSYTNQIMRICQMQRRPTTKQAEFIEDWQKKNISTKLIHRAYEITVERTDKLSFDYLNSILIKWYNSGYRTIEDVEAAEKDYRQKNSTDNNSQDSNGREKSSNVDKYKFVINDF